jgi:hypothetical protein
LEVNPIRADPQFAASFPKSDVAALPVANTLGAINRDDPRRCRIHWLPLSEQQRGGGAFRTWRNLTQHGGFWLP